MRKIFSVPLNPKLNPEQYKTYCEVLLEHKDYIKDIYLQNIKYLLTAILDLKKALKILN